MAVMETTAYTVPAEHEAALAAARPGIAAAMAELDGLERAETVALGDGRHADVVLWRDEEAHGAAMEAAMGDARLAPLFELITEVEMTVGEVLS